jgi:hypothetical protein
LARRYKEVTGLRRDVQEIKEMLVPEATPSGADRKAIARGRREYARGETEEWSDVRKRVAEK